MKIYMVEVGVELKENEQEFEFYGVKVNDKFWQSLFDENVIAFLDEQEAKSFIDEYVKEGVKNTYGFMWEIEREIEDYEWEDLKERNYLEDESYERQKVLYFKGGIER